LFVLAWCKGYKGLCCFCALESGLYHPLTTNSIIIIIIFFLECFINQPQLQTNQQAGTIYSEGHKNNKVLTIFEPLDLMDS
jgi:hypothetical protein